MINYKNFPWPKNLVDLLNKHWVMAPKTDRIIRNDIFWTVYRVSDKGAKLVNETLDYINGCSNFSPRDGKYTIDDAKEVLSMLDEIGKMFNVSRKIERKNEIQKAGKDYVI